MDRISIAAIIAGFLVIVAFTWIVIETGQQHEDWQRRCEIANGHVTPGSHPLCLTSDGRVLDIPR